VVFGEGGQSGVLILVSVPAVVIVNPATPLFVGAVLYGGEWNTWRGCAGLCHTQGRIVLTCPRPMTRCSRSSQPRKKRPGTPTDQRSGGA
jgi:hypothetical protein